MKKINTRKALNPAYRKHKPLRKDVTNFIEQLQDCINAVKLSDDNGESEEHTKSHFTTFFKTTFYANNYINTKDRIDLAIYLEDKPTSDVGVIIEAKKPSNKSEFLKPDNLNRKALQELLLYYLRERLDNNNNNIKHLIATNGYEWYLFKSEDFYNYFFKNKALIKEYKDFRDGLKDTNKNELFYNEIAKKYIAEVEQDLPYVHLDFTKTNLSKLQDGNLNTLYKIFSDVHILGRPFGNDSNQLNKTFYNELLHIIGLEEVKDKGKKVINRKTEKDRDYASLLENTIFHLEDRDYLSNIKSIPNGVDKPFNAGLDLCLTWVNRILFLKLLESQLLTYHQNDEKYKFLNANFINGFDDLNDLFFSALAKEEAQRHPKYKDKYKDIPYLNSSLFERNTLEDEAFEISALNNDEIAIYSGTVLKDANGKKQKGKLTTLEYLFKFLDAYNFATDGTEGIEDEQETKSLINASVLGLIFEKINGYKEGSFYTPAYITMYMCRETIRRTVVQKFKEQEEDQIETFEDLQSYCSRLFKVDDLKRLNNIVNSIKICDPAVGSGHFLVSALNELIVIKNELKILVDAKGMPLRCDIEIVNDELYVIDDKGALFEYNPTDKESVRVQHTLFHEKQTLIENCLFGVDINPNSVKICRLRLWIELLKNAYYTPQKRLQTLPNIDINIKCGNSLISRFKLDDDLKDAFKNKDLNYTFLDYKNAVTEYKETNSKDRKREVLKIINEVKNNFKSTLDKAFLVNFEKAQGQLINEQERQNNLKTFGEKIKKTEKDELKKLKVKAEKTYLEKEEIVNNAIYNNAFEWRFEFPEVLNDEGTYIGFDAVIGNPPYVQLSKVKSTSIKEKEYLIGRFGTSGGRLNTYIFFIHQSEKITNDNSFVSYIIPNTILTQDYYKETRRLLLEDIKLYEIGYFDSLPFDDAVVETVIISYSKVKNIKEINFMKFSEMDYSFDKSVLISKFINDESYRISYTLDKLTESFFEKESIIRLNQLTDINQGIALKGDKTLSIKNTNENNDYYKVLDGRNIHKYSIDWIDTFLDYSLERIHSCKTKTIFESNEKLFFRRVSANLIFTYDAEQYFALNTLVVINIKDNKQDEFQLKYLLAVLNSSLLQYIYKHKFKSTKTVFSEIQAKSVGLLPIKIIDFENQYHFSNKVNQILSLKQENPKANTAILEKEIDQMVYKLYDLTEEEITIVENS
jgi:adenine-specific DNA-methyltransferase